jgi:hypothetical protein
MELGVFWDFAQWSLVEMHRRLRGAYCLHRQGDELYSTSVVAYNVLTVVQSFMQIRA